MHRPSTPLLALALAAVLITMLVITADLRVSTGKSLQQEEEHRHHVVVKNWLPHTRDERNAIIKAKKYPTEVCDLMHMYHQTAICVDFDRIGSPVSLAFFFFFCC